MTYDDYAGRVIRYNEIVEMRAAGKSLGDIAKAFGISRARVDQILKGGVPLPNGRPPK